MAYDSSKLMLMAQSIKGDMKWWAYKSADAIATVRAANYISDAVSQGMNARDIVLVIDTATPTTQWCTVLTVAASGADLTDGLAIAETNS